MHRLFFPDNYHLIFWFFFEKIEVFLGAPVAQGAERAQTLSLLRQPRAFYYVSSPLSLSSPFPVISISCPMNKVMKRPKKSFPFLFFFFF